MQRGRWRIRSYLALLVLTVAVPVTGLLAYTIHTHLERALTDAESMALALAKISAQNTGNDVQNSRDVMARLAERPLVQALNPNRCDPILNDFSDFDDRFSNVVVMNRDGTVICSALSVQRRLSFADSKNFRQVMQKNRFVVGEPGFGKISKRWILPLAYPIPGDNGQPRGAIGAAIDLTRYTPIPTVDMLPAGTTTTLLNSTGIVLAHSQSPENWIGKPMNSTAIGRTVLQEQTGSVRMAGPDGEKRLFGFSQVPGSDWYTLVGIPTNVILAQARWSTLYHSLLLLLILSAAVLLAYLLGRRIEKPIRSIADTAKKVAAGDLQSRLTTTGPAEISVVATEFNNMLDRRQQAEEQLRETADHLRLAMDAARMGSWEWDIKRDEITCSDNTGPLFGLAEGEGFRNYDELLKHIHEEDIALVKHAVYQTMNSGMNFSCEYRVIWPDGSEHWIAARAQLLRDAQETPERMLGICMDITERMRSDQQMRYLASHDPLTGLINRHEFEQRLNKVLQRARNQNSQHAVLYMDLDQFKLVNDTCGHYAGDEMLRQLASLLARRIRESDTLARLGGDEFVVLLENCPLDNAWNVAEELRQTVTDFTFIWKGKSFKVGISIGLVPITDNQLSLEQVLSAADAACFVAKEHGRNRIHVHDAEDTALARHRGQMEWVSRIHAAIDDDRFCLHAQQICPLNETVPPHCELLIRMKDADDGLVPPLAFIPAAERYGLMPSLDRWIIETAFRELARHADRNMLCSIYNINLSGTSLADEELLSYISRQFYAFRISPASICFEITETAAIANLPKAIQFISHIKEMGCQIALDDFGSGMSSFTYLKNLSVDYLKIDGSFVRDMVRDPIDRAMVESINNIGHTMNIQTIAECVESEEIAILLRRMGVDFMQGYSIARPVPLDDLYVVVPENEEPLQQYN